MVNYVKSAALAKRLIEANGRDVVLHRKTRTPEVSGEPWRGPNPATSSVVGTVKAVFYPIEDRDEAQTLNRRGMEKMMIAHDSLDPAQDLSDIDHVVDGGVIYKVVQSNRIGPGSIIVAYEFIVRR
jgi:hypothetical protein